MKKLKDSQLEDLNKFLGLNENIKSHLNCMTRFRFEIIDKDKVDVNKIKQLDFVKGTNWSGDQFQVIIGPEVTFVREQYLKLFPENGQTVKPVKNTKTGKIKFSIGKSIKKTLRGFITNVFIPLIPALMAAGMMQALYAILIALGTLQSIESQKIVEQLISPEINIQSKVFFIISDVGMKVVGILVGYNTIRYLGGHPIMAVLIPVVLAGIYLFPATVGINRFELFSVNGFKVSFQSYAGSLLPQIGGGLIYIYLDRFFKLWIPKLVDLVFRHFLAFLSTGLIVFFLVGPLLGIVEFGIYSLFTVIQKIPYGIGIGLFGLGWTPLVLTGMHSALAVAVQSAPEIKEGIGSNLLALTSITSMTTIGTCLAVSIRAKETNMKNLAIGSLFSGAFGVSEPTYYAISMTRPILFLPVILARGLSGLAIGIFDIRAYQPGGRGILGWTAGVTANDPANLWKFIGIMAFACFVCFGLTLVTYKERKSEKKQINNLYSKVLKNLQIIKLKENKDNNVLYVAHKTKTADLPSKEYKTSLEWTKKLITNKDNLDFNIRNNELKIEGINEKLQSENINEKIQKKLQKNLEILEQKSKLLEDKRVSIDFEISDLINKIDPLHLRLENTESYKTRLAKLTKQLINQEYKAKIKKAEKEIIKKNNLDFNIKKSKSKIETINEKISAENVKPKYHEKLNILLDKNKQKLQVLKERQANTSVLINDLMKEIEPIHLEIEEKIKKLFNPLFKNESVESIKKFDNIIFNTVHDLEINYKLIDKLEA